MRKNRRFVADEESLAKNVGWVDHVIALHKSCVIEDFRVCFYFNKEPFAKYIDKCVEYALARKVKRLELNLSYKYHEFRSWSFDDRYTFPYKFMRQYKDNCSNILLHFMYLEKVRLNNVNVNGEALEFFLSNCPLLQHLSVAESFVLLTLKIIGPFPCLKHLEIISCNNLSSLEILDANLVYLKYVGGSIQKCLLKNVPQLVEMYIRGRIEMIDFLLMFSSILPQLEKLTFKMGCTLCWEVTEMLYSAVKMSKLKQLVVKPISDDSLLPLTNVLRASPCLESFELQISHLGLMNKRRKLQKIEGWYIHLKEVKIRGYCGMKGDLEFLMHLLESWPALEKIIIDPETVCGISFKLLLGFIPNLRDNYLRSERNARTRAKRQLVGKLPHGINLHIL